MDWRTSNFDWNRARAFLVTAEEGSFSAAARALGMAQPTLSRQVAALEEELDIALFERVGRGLKLTPTGLDMLEHMRAMADAASKASLIAAGQRLSLDGIIRISASQVLSAFYLPPIIETLRCTHPGITIDIIATNETSDLRKREADIAIRNFQPKDSALFAKKIREDTAYLYGAPGYIERLGPLTGPDDLKKAQFIGFNEEPTYIEGLKFLGLHLTPGHFPLLTESQVVQWELAKRGLGLCIMLEEIGEREPGLVRALESLPGYTVPMWLVSHRELKSSRRIRVVFDLLAEGLKAPLAPLP